VLAIVLLAIGAAGCHHAFVLDDDDIVFESEDLAPLSGGCVVRGTLRNETDHTARVFVTWRALDRDDDEIGRAELELADVPRDGRRDYESTRFRDFDGDRPGCAEIRRLKRDVFVTRD
jgi:hypothetical protein